MSRAFLLPATIKHCKAGISVFGSAALIVTGVAAATPSYAAEKPAAPAAVAPQADAPQTMASENNPTYEISIAYQGETNELAAPLNANGSQLPEGTTFAEGADFPDWATLHDDGSITFKVTPEVSAAPYDLTVVAQFSDGSHKIVKLLVNVYGPRGDESDADLIFPIYRAITLEQGQTKTTPAPGSTNSIPLPEGTQFTLNGDAPSWITLNADGSITAAPGEDVTPGEYIIPVRFNYPDTTQDDTTESIYVVVKGSMGDTSYAEQYNPSWQPETIEAGQSIILTYTGDDLPKDTIPVIHGDSGWGAGWISEGATVIAPKWAKPGQVGIITFEVLYPDGSSENIPVEVRVVGPGWDDASIKPGQTLTQANIGDAITATDNVEVTFPDNPGWTGSIDEAGNLVVTAPADAKDGEVGHALVKVSHATGGTAEIDVAFTVSDPSANRLYTPTYADSTVEQGSEKTVAVAEANGKTIPETATFELGADAPAWVRIADNGTFSATPGTDIAPGDYTVPVTVTYADGTRDTVNAKVTVTAKPTPVNSLYAPSYPDTTVVQDGQGTAKITEANGKEFPAGTTFVLGYERPEWTAIQEDGTLVLLPTTEVKPGDYSVPVTAIYPDGTWDDVTAKVTVTAKPTPVAYGFSPAYADTTVEQGATKTIAVTEENGKDFPTTAKFTAGAAAPTWATIAANGTITVAPGTDIKPGEYPVPVTVTYADGSTNAVTAMVTVTAKPAPVADSYAPSYTDTTVEQGAEKTVAVTVADGKTLPETAKFALGAEAPTWANIADDGTITVAPGTSVEPGDYTVPVTVTYADGTRDAVNAKVTVTKRPDLNAVYNPTWENGEVKPGETVTLAYTGDEMTDSAYAEVKFPSNWKVTINDDDALVATAPADAKDGDSLVLDITVTYSDGTVDTTQATIVVKADAEVVPAPVETEEPAPVETTPAPVETTPAPVETEQPAEPAPVETTPAPAETEQTAEPVETTEPAESAEPAQPAPAQPTETQVAAPLAPAPSSPAPVVEQQSEQPALAYTGAAGVGALGGLGALALLAGGALVAARRRHS